MKKVFSFLISLLAIAAFLPSCGEDNGPTTPGDTEFKIPLKVGNQWTYRAYTSGQGFTDTVTHDIYGTTSYNGGKVYLMRGYPDLAEWYFMVSDEGFYMGNPDDLFVKYIPLPMDTAYKEYVSGEEILTWGENDKFKDTVRRAVEIIAADETVNVPAGQFNCVVSSIYYESNEGARLSAGETLYYFASGTGVVKITNTDLLLQSSGKELIDFDLQ